MALFLLLGWRGLLLIVHLIKAIHVSMFAKIATVNLDIIDRVDDGLYCPPEQRHRSFPNEGCGRSGCYDAEFEINIPAAEEEDKDCATVSSNILRNATALLPWKRRGEETRTLGGILLEGEEDPAGNSPAETCW